jgi:hypothetical protein
MVQDVFPLQEIIMHGAGRFPNFRKSSCTVQDVFPSSENHHARCRTFSQVLKIIMHDAGH